MGAVVGNSGACAVLPAFHSWQILFVHAPSSVKAPLPKVKLGFPGAYLGPTGCRLQVGTQPRQDWMDDEWAFGDSAWSFFHTIMHAGMKTSQRHCNSHAQDDRIATCYRLFSSDSSPANRYMRLSCLFPPLPLLAPWVEVVVAASPSGFVFFTSFVLYHYSHGVLRLWRGLYT